MPMITELINIYDRDLSKLKAEIEAFKNEANLWSTVGNTANPAGNLCLHLVGNLKTYIGKNLGHVSYVRDRAAEFTKTGVARSELLQQIEETRSVVISSLRLLDPSILQATYVENVLGFEMTTGFFLLHLATHLSYHLGQVNYLRRVLE
jgi:uncharacterized damage-inducible protein DinB